MDIKQIGHNKKIILILFFFSGFAALQYQIIWQRWLVFFTGVGSVSICLIVSAFMAGLGIGYLAGGIIADKTKNQNQLIIFVLVELLLGIFALCSKYLFFDVLYESNLLAQFSKPYLYFSLFLLLLFPTFLMGLSLPLLSKSLNFDNLRKQQAFLANLYFTNTLGASLGALITGLLLIRWLGFQTIVNMAAGINFCCSLLALFIYKSKSFGMLVVAKPVAQNSVTNKTNNIDVWYLQSFVSGFFAIAFEILWFRILDVTIKSNSMTFSIVLFIFLFFLALGTKFGVWLISNRQFNQPKVFLNVQILLYLYTTGAILILYWLIKDSTYFSFLSGYFGQYDISYQFKILLFTYIIIPFFLMALPTFLMGLSFSITQSIIQDNYSYMGSRLGWMQFLNIIGSILGAISVTFIGLNFLGTPSTVKWIGIIGITYAIIALYVGHINWYRSLAYLALFFFIFFKMPSLTSFWLVFNGISQPEMAIIDEDDSAVSCIKLNKKELNYDFLFFNGLGQSILPFKTDSNHIALGAIPSLLHPKPAKIAIIGLGSGGTLYNAMGRPQTVQVDCFEVISNLPELLKNYAINRNDQVVTGLFNDKRLSLKMIDGRFHLQNDTTKYDIIEADALRPRSTYSGNLYSIEYFNLLKNRINNSGFVITWMPTSRVKNTFTQVFEHVYAINNFMLVGSKQPFQVDLSTIQKNINNDFTKAHFEKANIYPISYLTPYFRKVEYFKKGNKETKPDINTDLFPKDEFDQLGILKQKMNI